jgi:hypothetical protein
MTNSVTRAARDLFEADRRTRNIRFYFHGDNCSQENLADYRNRAVAQINSGLSVENVDLDRDLLD